jgi:hypothetical protein
MQKFREVWKLGHHEPFKTSFDNLELQDKWRVEHAITELLSDHNPEKHYPSVQCPECGMEDVYLAAVAHDGIGNMGVELEFNVNRIEMVLTPIFTSRVKLFNKNSLVKR